MDVVVAVIDVGKPEMKLLIRSIDDAFVGIEISDVDPGTMETKNRFNMIYKY